MGWARYVVVALMAIPACGGEEPADARAASAASAAATAEVSIVATDFAFEVSPQSVHAGVVETTLANQGEEPHQAGYYRLNAGVDYEEFVASITKDDSMIPQLATGGRAGHMRGLAAGETGVRPGDELEPGVYAVLCSIRDPETGKNHYELGMIARLDVN